MFSASAELYDLIYSGFKDYNAEATQLATTIRRVAPRAHAVLDVACGTGEHARLLTTDHGFDVDGLDLDPEFIKIAQGKLPAGTVFHGDMTSFAIPGRYDAILCLFSSIGYAGTLESVTTTFERFRAHLAPDGVVIVEPWFPPGVLESGRTTVNTAEAGGVAVCRMSHLEVEDRMSRIRFEYLIGRPTGIERASEVHELGLFTTDELLECFHAAGLAAEHDPVGLSNRGLFVARTAT